MESSGSPCNNKLFDGTIIIIYSCLKNAVKADMLYKLLRNLINEEVKLFIVFGIPHLKSEYLIDDNKLYLKCKDNYDGLYLKTKKLFEEIVKIYPNLSGLIKMDDDIYPNIDFMKRTIYITSMPGIDYCGSVHTQAADVVLLSSHIPKCEEVRNKIKMMLPECTYASGPCYYVSKKAIKYFNANCKEFFSEDVMVGLTFYKSIIRAINYQTYHDDKSYMHLMNIQNYTYKEIHNHLTFIRLHGGLGNQMFQVAAGLSYCKKNVSLPILVYEPSSNPHGSIKRALDTVFHNLNSLIINDVPKMPITMVKPRGATFTDAYNYDRNLFPITKYSVILDGYFQNEKYFRDIRETIHDRFINEKIRDKLRLQFENIDESYFIHVRRGDYVGNKLYEIDYDSYYQKAINVLSSNEDSINYYVVSNDIEYCKTYKYFKSDEKSKFNFIENIDEIETLYLMTLCKGGITCNSSFSWWGGYLNDKNERARRKILATAEEWKTAYEEAIRTEDKGPLQTLIDRGELMVEVANSEVDQPLIILPKQWLPNENINMGYGNTLLL